MKENIAMKLTIFSVLMILTLTGSAVGQSRPSESGPSSFEGIKKTYSEIRTLEARFHQTIFIASLKKERESEGEFLYKRQRGFLWRYKTPKVKLFPHDGKYIW